MSEDKITEYAEGYLWYLKEDEETIVVGLTQKSLDYVGKLAELDLPPDDGVFNEGQWMGCLVGSEDEVEITAPFALEVKEINRTVTDELELLEEDPTGDAWLVRGTMSKNE